LDDSSLDPWFTTVNYEIEARKVSSMNTVPEWAWAALVASLVCLVIAIATPVLFALQRVIQRYRRRQQLLNPPIIWNEAFIGPERWDWERHRVRNWERLVVDI
jgi:hypothetical protein